MTKLFEKTTTTKIVSKKRPKTLLVLVPAQIRDFLEIKPKNKLLWVAEIDDNDQKVVKIYKKD